MTSASVGPTGWFKLTETARKRSVRTHECRIPPGMSRHDGYLNQQGVRVVRRLLPSWRSARPVDTP